MHKKFDINRTKIKGGCQTERKVVTYNSKSNLPLHIRSYFEAERKPTFATPDNHGLPGEPFYLKGQAGKKGSI